MGPPEGRRRLPRPPVAPLGARPVAARRRRERDASERARIERVLAGYQDALRRRVFA